MSEPGERLTWDTDHFGVPIGRVLGRRLDDAMGRAVVEWQERLGIRCAYLFADPNDRGTARAASEHGFMLADVRLDLSVDVVDVLPPEGIRTARTEDLTDLRAIAATAHTDTRFFFDERFSRDAAASLYGVWIERSLDGEIADIVLTTDADGRASGYITAALDRRSMHLRIGLLAVAERARGIGVGGRLLSALAVHARAIGATRISVATQARNVTAQRLYQSAGYRTTAADAIYHRWATPSTAEPQLVENAQKR